MGTWFEGVLLPLESVGGGDILRAQVLRKRGITTKTAYKTFKKDFKKWWGKKASTTGKTNYKRELLDPNLRHIRVTP